MHEIDIFPLIIQGFANVFTFWHCVYMFIGMAVGIIVSLIPGLTATTACALLIPFTFNMEPATGLIILGSIWVGGMYGGAISAILMNIPGAPGNVPAAFDGWPLTQKGQGERAILAALLSSGVGTVLGVAILMFCFAPLATFSLKFTHAEYFWLCVFGLSTIASMSRGNCLKGVLGGGIGMAITTIGIDPVVGLPRFTFGIDGLIEGINMVPALIGLFAISTIVELTSENKNTIAEYKRQPHALFTTAKFLLQKCKMCLLRSSLIGTYIGVLPGAGAPVASMISYSESVRWDKEPDRFGKGAIEGVCATQAACNSVIGGSLVPMLSLGIPGCPIAALVLGALCVHGIQPGSKMLIESGDIAYTFICSLLVSTIALIIVGLLMMRISGYLLSVPVRLIAPMVIVISFIGCYAIRNSAMDVYIMLACGALQFVLTKFGIGPGPVSLGLVLAPIMENALNITITVGSANGNFLASFIGRPLSQVFIGLTLLALLFPMIQGYRQKRLKENTSNTQPRREGE